MNRRGFTLIELLIVIAIIAILALIAVPNFLEAQVRAKVSACRANMNSVATGLEAYAVDWGAYPPGRASGTIVGAWMRPLSLRLNPLTTPVAYMSSIPVDQFPISQHGNNTDPDFVAEDDTYDYIDIACAPPMAFSLFGRRWRLASAGPDMKQTFGGLSGTYEPYDSTNGTMSYGDIVLVEGGGNGWPVPDQN